MLTLLMKLFCGALVFFLDFAIIAEMSVIAQSTNVPVLHGLRSTPIFCLAFAGHYMVLSNWVLKINCIFRQTACSLFNLIYLPSLW